MKESNNPGPPEGRDAYGTLSFSYEQQLLAASEAEIDEAAANIDYGDITAPDSYSDLEMPGMRTSRAIISVEENPIFPHLEGFHQWGATTAATVLNMGEVAGHLNLSEARSILDFGAGGGGPTLALAELAEKNGGIVTAVESIPASAQGIIDSGILPAEQVVVGDGLEVLRTTPEKYDLITAFMLGPDNTGSFTRAFLDSCPGSPF